MTLTRPQFLAGLAAAVAAPGIAGADPQRTAMPAPIVFIDIAGPDTAKLNAFYSAVFGWEFDARGGFSVQAGPVGPLTGTLRQDPAEKLFYMGVPDINATLELIKANGGTVAAPRFEVPGVVVLALWADPAGNRMGLVEMDGDRAKVP